MGFSLLYSTSLLSADKIQIYLRNEVTVTSSHYNLGQIAKIDLIRIARSTDLKSMVMGVSPRPAYHHELTAALVKRLITARYPELRNKIVMRGASRVNIWAKGLRVATRSIRAMAKNYLLTELTKSYSEVSVDVLVNGAEHKNIFLYKNQHITLIKHRDILLPSSRMQVWFAIKQGKKVIGRFSVWCKVSAKAKVYVLRHSIKSRTSIKKRDFIHRWVDVAHHQGQWVKSIVNIDQQWLLRRHSKGEVLMSNTVRKIPDIIKGTRVSVLVNTESIQLHIFAIAQTDARIGSMVTLKNESSGRLFHAQVIRRNVALVKVGAK